MSKKVAEPWMVRSVKLDTWKLQVIKRLCALWELENGTRLTVNAWINDAINDKLERERKVTPKQLADSEKDPDDYEV